MYNIDDSFKNEFKAIRLYKNHYYFQDEDFNCELPIITDYKDIYLLDNNKADIIESIISLHHTKFRGGMNTGAAMMHSLELIARAVERGEREHQVKENMRIRLEKEREAEQRRIATEQFRERVHERFDAHKSKIANITTIIDKITTKINVIEKDSISPLLEWSAAIKQEPSYIAQSKLVTIKRTIGKNICKLKRADIDEPDCRLSLFKYNEHLNTVSSKHIMAQLHSVNEYENYLTTEIMNLHAVARKIYEDTNKLTLINQINKYVKLEDLRVFVKLKNDIYKCNCIIHNYSNCEYETYDVCFDGGNFRKIEKIPETIEIEDIIGKKEKNTKYWACTSSSDIIIAWKDCILFQANRILNSIEFNRYKSHTTKVALIEGVPGCGKTSELVSIATEGDLILTVTKETKDDIKQRIRLVGKNNIVRTVDSYLINDHRFYKRILLDEGLMLHAGQIDIMCWRSKAKHVTIFGDRNQLGFINRLSNFEMKYANFERYVNVEQRNLSYRCPADIAKIFSPKYLGGFKTISKIKNSMAINFIATAENLFIPVTYKILTFTQDEKKILKSKYKNVNTIHEIQGKTFNKVALIRLNAKSLEIYDSINHILVGLTRHTHYFIYHSVGGHDTVVNYIRSVGYDSETLMQELVRYDEFKTETSSFNEDSCSDKFEMYIDWEIYQKQRIRTSLVEETILNIKKKHVIEKDAVSEDFLITIKDLKEFNIIPKRTDLVHYTIDSNPIVTLQIAYDSIFPGASIQENLYDQEQVEMNELNLHIENVILGTSKLGEGLIKPIKPSRYIPNLRTAQPHKRNRSLKQSLLAFINRNADTPKHSRPQNIKLIVTESIKKFLKTFANPIANDMLVEFYNKPVFFSEQNLIDWLNAQEPQKIKRIDYRNFELSIKSISNYFMMIKSDAKNRNCNLNLNIFKYIKKNFKNFIY